MYARQGREGTDGWGAARPQSRSLVAPGRQECLACDICRVL